MTQPSPAQIAAGVKALRAELTTISSWLIDYNSKITDEQAAQAVTIVGTAILSVPAPNPKPSVPPAPHSMKGK